MTEIAGWVSPKYAGWPTVYIYVCKGDEPFALKESKSNNAGSSNTSTSASYTIDF